MAHPRHLIDGLQIYVLRNRSRFGFRDNPVYLDAIVARLADTGVLRRGDGPAAEVESMVGPMSDLIDGLRRDAPHLFRDDDDGAGALISPAPSPRTPPVTGAQAKGLSAREKLALSNGEAVPTRRRPSPAETAMERLLRANAVTVPEPRYAEGPAAPRAPRPTPAKRRTASQSLALANGDKLGLG